MAPLRAYYELRSSIYPESFAIRRIYSPHTHRYYHYASLNEAYPFGLVREKLKIGILGGTFNPIHNGHLINAQIIKEDYSLNTVIFLPTKDPVHKTLDDGVSPENRFEMIKLAIYDNNGFDASRIEIDRDSESYTITTLKQLIGMNKGNKLYLIVGYDTFEQIETWKDYEKVLKMVSLIVMKRPGEPIYNEKILNMASEVLFANNPFIEISSSHIRKRIIEGKPIKYFVPGRVEEYIINKGLYKN